MLNLKKRFPVEYKVDETSVIKMKLKRLTFEEALPFELTVTAVHSTLPEKSVIEAMSPRELLHLIARTNAALPPGFAAQVFRDFVSDVEVLENGQVMAGEDGVPITTGEQLYEVADRRLVNFVVTSIRGQAGLSEAEGKDSGSPSTSPTPAHETSDGPSDAPAIASGDGREPSTAMETQTAEASSSGPA